MKVWMIKILRSKRSKKVTCIFVTVELSFFFVGDTKFWGETYSKEEVVLNLRNL